MQEANIDQLVDFLKDDLRYVNTFILTFKESDKRVITIMLTIALCGYPIVKMEIGDFKSFKSKCLVFAQFLSKYDNSSGDW